MRTLQYVDGDRDIIAFPAEEVTSAGRHFASSVVLDMRECAAAIEARTRSYPMLDMMSSMVEMQMRAPQVMAQMTQSYFMMMAGAMGMVAESVTPNPQPLN